MSEIRKRIKNDWSDNNQKRYIWIYNKLKEGMNGFNYDLKDYILKMSKPKLLNFIKKLDIGQGSKEAMHFTVSKYLQLFDKDNKAYQNFQREGHKLLDASKKKEGENLVDDKHIESYQNFDYFLKILKDKDYKTITNLKEHNEYLLLSLLILQPPLRTNFYSSAILTNTNKTKPDDKSNYLLLKTVMGKNRGFYIVNSDKVSNTKQFKMDISKNIIELDNPNLIELLNYSIQKFPRTYLFENINKSKVSEDTLRNYLRKITKLSNINFDIIRSIFISHAYNTTAKTVNQREKLAISMRHSPEIAQRAYFKIKPDDKATNKITDNELILRQQERIIQLNIENNELKLKLQEYQPIPGDKLYNKRRADIVARLNKGFTVKPETLKKYDLNKDTLTIKQD